MMISNNTLYLYETSVDLVLQGNQYQLDNRPMNTRYIKVHRGIHNTIHFQITDRDRVGQNVSNRITDAIIVDPQSRTQIFRKRCEVGLDHVSVRLELTTSDLNQVSAGLYEMFLESGYPDGVRTGLYSNQHNDITFDLEVTDQGRYDPPPTQETSQMLLGSGGMVVSDMLSGNIRLNHNNPQHTLAITTEQYTGVIRVQSSQITGVPASEAHSRDWSDLVSIQTNNSTTTHNFTFIQSTNWIRVVHQPATPSDVVGVTRIQLRN